MKKEGRKNISEARKRGFKEGRIKANSPWKDKKLGEEHKRKISLANKGKKKPLRTKEHRERLSMSHKGKHHSIKTEFKKGQKSWIKGLTKENNKIVKNISLKHVGKKVSKETRDKISKGNKGKKVSLEVRKKISEALKGKNSPRYIDGRSYDKSPLRYGDDWNEIRKIVYRRDLFTCQKCGKQRVSLDIHHIIPFLDGGSNELDNLTSLCRSCHMKIESKRLWGKKKCV